MQIVDIGEVRPDGSILLYDDNIKFRKDLTTPRRTRQSQAQKLQQAREGLQWVNSSFIAGVGAFGDDLVISFLNGSKYQYYGFAGHYEKMLQANSKGRYFWRNIRKTRLYDRIGTVPLYDGLDVTDEELFKQMAQDFNKVIIEMIKAGTTKIIFDEVTRQSFINISFKGEEIFLKIDQ